MEEVKLRLDKKQITKLMKGKLCQLKSANLREPNCSLALHSENAKKIKRARRADKGVRLTLSPAEIEASVGGEGIKDILQTIKKGAKKVKGFYDENLKETFAPVLKKMVKEGKEMGINALKAYNPAIGMFADELDERIGDKAVDSLGKLSGAYGKRTKSIYDPLINVPPPGVYLSTGRGLYSAEGQGFKPAGYGVGGSFRA